MRKFICENRSVDYLIDEIRQVARKWHQEKLNQANFAHKTQAAKRLREAATRAMDLADGEADWATKTELTHALLAPTRAQYSAIRLGYCRRVGGFTHKRGEANYYAVKILNGIPYITVSGHASILAGD